MYIGTMNTATVKNAKEIFTNQLDALELLFDMKLTGETPGARLDSLREQALANAELHESLKKFLDTPLQFASRFSASSGIFASMVRTFFGAASRGAVHDYGPQGAPKKQHWMPLAYLNSFGDRASESKNNRSLTVPGVSFADGMAMDFETRDSSFIHDRVNGSGFYEDGAEFFFHLVEGLYAQSRSGRSVETNNTVIALFFFTQSVRNPRYGQRFVHNKLSAIVDAILANMEAVGPTMEVKVLKSPVSLPFTPYVPPFVDRIQGEKVYGLPIEPKKLFCISTGPVEETDWKNVPKRYCYGVISQAVRRRSYIFGVQKVQFSSHM